MTSVLFSCRLARNSSGIAFTFAAAQGAGAFSPVHKAGLLLFPREANCKGKVEHLKCKESRDCSALCTESSEDFTDVCK